MLAPCEASRRFIWATTRCTWLRSWAGFDGSARSSSRSGGPAAGRRALDQLPLELAAHVLLEPLEVVARHRVRVGQLRSRRLLALAAQAEAPPDALHVHADHAGALALAAEGHDREPREVAHLAVGAARIASRMRSRRSSRSMPSPPL